MKDASVVFMIATYRVRDVSERVKNRKLKSRRPRRQTLLKLNSVLNSLS
jgi:hypothetical protein